MAAPKLNPTPSTLPPLRLATQLDADRQQERRSGSWQEEARAQRPKKAFLEQDTASYTQKEKTEAESELSRQRGMIETAEQLSPEGIEPGTAERPSETPPQSGIQRRPAAPAEEEAAAQEEDAQQQEIQRALQFQQLQQFELQAQRAEAQEIDKVEQGVNLIQKTKKEWQNIRQFSEAASGVGFVLLVLELNAQTIATLFGFKIPGLQKASKPRMVLTACLDLGALFNLVILFLPMILLVLITWWLIENPIQAFLVFVTNELGL